MNSYNENLSSVVFATLMNLEQEQQKVKSKLDASTFTLYYAQGATITAFENFEEARKSYRFEEEVKAQAVNVNNISGKVLQSANQQKDYTAQSVTNAAVCASNVQVAANAIIRLASDVGNIYSILKASDFDSDLFRQGDMAYNLINETASAAEAISETAMEASAATAEVSSATVADQAKNTNASVDSLFKLVSADFDAAAANAARSNTGLASASAAEKIAEGVLELNGTDYHVTTAAIRHSNRELNLNLTVSVFNAKPVASGEPENGAYEVRFAFYKAPFKIGEPEPAGYPVATYHVMLVKDSKKSTFSIANAENLINTGKSIKVESYPAMPGQVEARIKIQRPELKDSDGDVMELGKRYVVFVLAIFADDYKKTINIFDDYLTAPSAVFELTNLLASPSADSIKSGAENKITFTVPENDFSCEYRCMFLPGNTSLTQEFLVESGLRSIQQEVQKLEDDTVTMNPPDPAKATKSGVFFNVEIAEQVSRANYLIAEVTDDVGTVLIENSATDNFGNPLIEGKSYVPVILTIANLARIDLDNYTSALSDYENTDSYIHKSVSKSI